MRSYISSFVDFQWQMTSMFGMGEFGEDAILGKLEGMKDVIEQVNRQFKDPVCIYLSCLIYSLTSSNNEHGQMI